MTHRFAPTVRIASAVAAALLASACSSRDAVLEEKIQRAEQAAQRAEAAQAKAEKAAEKVIVFSSHGGASGQSNDDSSSHSRNGAESSGQDPDGANLDPKPDNPDA